MTKQEIMNNYAHKQGYEDWYSFALHYKIKGCSTHTFLKHQNKVIDLIQEELKKEIHEKVMNNDISFVIDDEGILNTPNL